MAPRILTMHGIDSRKNKVFHLKVRRSQIISEYSSIHAFIDTENSPIYKAFENDTIDWIHQNNGIWPKDFISVLPDQTARSNYCPPAILMNTNFDDPKFLKWSQIFYGMTFVFMCLGVLHFYDIDRLLGPLSISIGRMLGDLGIVSAWIKLCSACFELLFELILNSRSVT